MNLFTLDKDCLGSIVSIGGLFELKALILTCKAGKALLDCIEVKTLEGLLKTCGHLPKFHQIVSNATWYNKACQIDWDQMDRTHLFEKYKSENYFYRKKLARYYTLLEAMFEQDIPKIIFLVRCYKRFRISLEDFKFLICCFDLGKLELLETIWQQIGQQMKLPKMGRKRRNINKIEKIHRAFPVSTKLRILYGNSIISYTGKNINGSEKIYLISFDLLAILPYISLDMDEFLVQLGYHIDRSLYVSESYGGGVIADFL